MIMTSNKTSWKHINDGYKQTNEGYRQTNEGYLSREEMGSRMKSSLRSSKNQFNNHNEYLNKNNDNRYYKKHGISYISQSEQEQSDYEYSFKNRAINSQGVNQVKNGQKAQQGSSGKGVNGKEMKGRQKEKQKGKQRSGNEQSNKRVVNKARSVSHQAQGNNKSDQKSKPKAQQQDKVGMLQELLKECEYQKQVLGQKLVKCQFKCQSLSNQMKELQVSYSQLQKDYSFLKHQYNQLLQKHIELQKHLDLQSVSNPTQKNKQSQLSFIEQCQQEINRLKILVKELSEQKAVLEMRQSPSEREEIKDRIIIKLQDQLITHKLLLQEARQPPRENNNSSAYSNLNALFDDKYHNNKYINKTNLNNQVVALRDISSKFHNSNHKHTPSYQQPFYQQNQLSFPQLTTDRTRFTPTTHHKHTFSALSNNLLDPKHLNK